VNTVAIPDHYNEYDEADGLIRRFVEDHDPRKRLRVGPMTVTPAQLRQSADMQATRSAQRSAGSKPTDVNGRALSVWHRLCIPTAASLALIMSLVAPLSYLAASEQTHASGQPAAPAPLQEELAGKPVDARSALKELAARVAIRSDPPAPVGAYTYIRTQTWSDDTVIGNSGAARSIVARDEQLWWAADRSGRTLVTTLPAQDAGQHSTQWLRPPPTMADHSTRNFQPGELALVMDTPSDNPAILAGQLSAHDPFAHGPQATLRAIAEMCRFHLLDTRQRTAMLQVLVDTDGLQFRGKVTDRAGRTGIAISADSGGGATRDIVVLDNDTGALLSHEQLALSDGLDSPTPSAAVTAYVLYLDAKHTNYQY
jgi:hypothetical protein